MPQRAARPHAGIWAGSPPRSAAFLVLWCIAGPYHPTDPVCVCHACHTNCLPRQVNIPRVVLRKNERLKELHSFIIQHTTVGSITRQETVSMLPCLALDVQPGHRVLDMCAAPGMFGGLHFTKLPCHRIQFHSFSHGFPSAKRSFPLLLSLMPFPWGPYHRKVRTRNPRRWEVGHLGAV